MAKTMFDLYLLDLLGHEFVKAARGTDSTAGHEDERAVGQYVVDAVLDDERLVVVRDVVEDGMRDVLQERSTVRRVLAQRADRLAAKAVHEPAELVGVPGVHGLAYQRRDAQLGHEHVVHVLRVGEQLGYDVQVRSDRAADVEHVLGDVNGRRVAVVQPNAVKDAARLTRVRLHVRPEGGRVGRCAAVAKLHRVAPRKKLTTKVHLNNNNNNKKAINK